MIFLFYLNAALAGFGLARTAGMLWLGDPKWWLAGVFALVNLTAALWCRRVLAQTKTGA